MASRDAAVGPAASGGGDAPPGSQGIAGGVAAILASRALSTAASLVGQVLIARWLGPSGNGALFAATTVLAIAMLAGDLGVNTSVSRALARAYYDDRRAVPRILTTGLALKLVLTLVVAAALYGGAGTLSRALGGGDDLAPVIAFAAAQLFLDNLATFAFRGLQGLHDTGRLALAQTVSGVASPLLAAGIVYAGWGAAGAVAGRALGAGLAAVYGAATLVTLVRAMAAASGPESAAAAGAGAGRAPPASRALARELVGFAGQIFWVNVAYLVFFRVDQGLVQIFLGSEALGIYGQAAAIVEKCLLPAVAIGTVAAPRFASLRDSAPGASADRAASVRALFARSLRSILLLYVPAAAGLAVLADDAVRVVFGPPYAPAAPILRAFAVALPVLALATLLGTILDYAGLARARARAFLLAAAADLALNALLLPRLGSIGAVASLAVGFTPLVAYYLVALARHLDAPVIDRLPDLARAAAAALAMVAALWLVRPAEPGPLALAGLVALGAATYGLALAALGGLRRGP